MRRGFPGVALLVQETLKRDPHCGHLFVFRGRRGDLIKIIWHDGQGACLFSKRLERERFLWPSPADGVVTISPVQLGYLLEGIDWRAPPKTWRHKLLVKRRIACGVRCQAAMVASMMRATAALPDDIVSLKAIVLAQDQLIEALKLTIAKFRRGTRRISGSR